MKEPKFKTLRDITDNFMSSVQKTEFHREMYPDYISRSWYMNDVRHLPIKDLDKWARKICKGISKVKRINFETSDLFNFDPQNKLSSVVAA